MLDLIQTRRDLHQIPEIGLEEFKTQAYLLDVIEKLTAGKNFFLSTKLFSISLTTSTLFLLNTSLMLKCTSIFVKYWKISSLLRECN